MASPNTVFTEIVATTFRNHSSEISDNFTKHNALYRKLAKGGKVRKESGGYSIVQPLEYAANGTYQRYSGFDVLNVAQSDVFSAAEFNWRQIALNVVGSDMSAMKYQSDIQSLARWNAAAMRSRVILPRT